jgi:hypothetical protein
MSHRFPSVAWFEALVALMREQRARHVQLGYIDCVARFTALDDGGRASVQVRFEEFAAVEVSAVGAHTPEADFELEAPAAVWRTMLESIAAGGGRPDLPHTLNHLTHMGTPMVLRGADPLRRDLFFRYNQSLQEFFNASCALATTYAVGTGDQ